MKEDVEKIVVWVIALCGFFCLAWPLYRIADQMECLVEYLDEKPLLEKDLKNLSKNFFQNNRN